LRQWTDVTCCTEVRRSALTRILTAHDNRLLAEAIFLALRRQRYDVQTVVAEPPKVVVDFAAEWRPNITILGIELRRGVPDGMSVISALMALGSAVIVFTDPDADTLRAACVKAGAAGMVTVNDSLPTFLAVIARVAAGQAALSDSDRLDIVRRGTLKAQRDRELRAPFDQLSRKEKEVLIAIMHGQSADQIAVETFVSVATVRSHIHSILAKLGVTSQLAGVAAAIEAGWPHARRPSSV
jgi:two-component system, NarL family, nitrate/nitrite response regulator NarL